MAESPQVLVNDSIRRQVLLEGVKANEAAKFQPYLKSIEKDIRNRLTAEGLTIRNRTRLNAVLVDVRAIEKEYFDEWIEQLELDLNDIADTEGNLEVNVLSSVTEDSFEPILPSPEQLQTAYQQNALSVRGKSQGMPLTPFLRQYDSDQKALIEGTISQGFTEGRTNAQIVQDLRGTRANNYQDGVLANVDRNTDIMVRTAVQNSSAQARQEVWNKNSSVIQGVEWVSTLDSRTTTQCRSLDGEVFPIDSGPRPPIHYGCRSTTSPVLDSSLDFLDEGAKRPAKGVDSDGKTDIKQVRATTSYYDWLKTQPAQFQDTVIGPTRGRLLRNGGMTSEQFANLQLNKNFKPMTLDEMAEEAPKAFEEANLLNDDGSVKIANN